MSDEVQNDEYEEFEGFIKEWAWKKMRKLERKIKRFAKIYFGGPVVLMYFTRKQYDEYLEYLIAKDQQSI